MEATNPRRSVCVWTLALALMASVLWAPHDAFAQPEPIENGKHPRDFFVLEFFIGSIAGMAMETLVDNALFNYYCAGNSDPELCRSVTQVFFLGPYTPVASQFVGSSAGIISMGILNGVNGNIPATLIGSLSGSLAGIVVQKPIFDLLKWTFQQQRLVELQQNPNTPELVKRLYPTLIEFFANNETQIRELSLTLIPPIIASIFGTIGFNVGASMYDVE